MISEHQLIDKKFYETLLTKTEEEYPIQVLGEAYLEEEKKELPDLGDIRFAQGEIYYHYKDYEAAIFKWGQIEGGLAPWAKKNSADAYYELGMLSTAEPMYKSIETDSLVLRSEAALQLFSLYIEEERYELASETIKEAVAFNPDYPNVTKLARSFFEGQLDWESAVDLAANEGTRTEELKWFDVLQDYIDRGHTASLNPEYFIQVLQSLSILDRNRFERLVLSLWSVYERQGAWHPWLNTINAFFTTAEFDSFQGLSGVTKAYKNTYLALMDGSRLLAELNPIMPETLSNWLRIADEEGAVFAAAAILAWNEAFRGSLDALIVQEAEARLGGEQSRADGFAGASALYDEILRWAESQELQIGYKDKWMVRHILKPASRALCITGADASSSRAVVNILTGDEILPDHAAGFTAVRAGEQHELKEISSNGTAGLSSFEEAGETRRNRESILEASCPSAFLKEMELMLLHASPFNGGTASRNGFFDLAHMAAGLLVVLDAENPFTSREREFVQDVRKRLPGLPVHFVMTRLNRIFNEQDAIRVLEDTEARVREVVPEAEVLAMSGSMMSTRQLEEAADFIDQHYSRQADRTNRMLYFIRKALSVLIEKRAEMENEHTESIRWNEEMDLKLNGGINQINDLEAEKSRVITKSYRMIKEEIRNDILVRIPELLQDCSELLKEDSDFRKIHLLLNQEMNEQIQGYMTNRVLPKFHQSLQNWIDVSREEFNQSQFQLKEMAEGFNILYGEERMLLEGDFRVLDDWRRDADRMTSMVQIDDMNILLRHTPSQLLLKGAGKLLGGIANKAALYGRYKKFLDTMDYDDVAQQVAAKFLSQFSLFEKSLERDISMFFRNPYQELQAAVEQSNLEIAESQAALDRMREKPELYQDPMTIFKIRVRQYELIEER